MNNCKYIERTSENVPQNVPQKNFTLSKLKYITIYQKARFEGDFKLKDSLKKT
ncbi:hypothetical protein NitYY0826_C1536 [Nitratiruptor sp. YY08-26]|nr:hypothetical protein NitYY0813_C1534 [Nitratiruptor sp. YY08-13]BCD66590.1 hypothetical protein NitYY0826_C1536 [Nitratiruptor sp. YY08-26]